MTAAPRVAQIATPLNRVYFAHADAIEQAQANGDRDVPLCQMDGSPIPPQSFDRATLRLSTIDASTVTPFPPAPAPAPAPAPTPPPTPTPAPQVQPRSPRWRPRPGMRPADEILLSNSRRTVDLPGYLAARGWTLGEGDTARWRQMDGPNGQRLLVRRTREAGEWVWAESHDTSRWRTFYDLIRHLDGGSHGQIMGAVRRAVASPPTPLDFGRSHTPTTISNTPRRPRPPRSLPILDEVGTAYLTGERLLHPDTVAAFAHSLGSLPGGVVVAIHNQAHDGEEKGPNEPGRFTGSLDDTVEGGPARGRSLWIAQPHRQSVPEQLIVSDAFLDAMSCWEFHPFELQPVVAVASTGGTPSAASDDKLIRILVRMVQEHGKRITPVLIDASDVGEADEQKRTAWLRHIAAEIGVEYRRMAPQQGKDWNECLKMTKAQVEEAKRTYLAPTDESEHAPENEGRRIGGISR